MGQPRRKRVRKSNVVSLRGSAPPVPTVVPAVVEKLEDLLDRAKSGFCVGLLYVAIDPAAGTIFGRCGIADRESMIVGAARLSFDLLADDRDAG